MEKRVDLLDSIADSSKSVLMVMVGPPGSGKSTLADDIQKETGMPIVSSDAIRKEMLGDESIQRNQEEVFDRVYSRIKKHSIGKHNVLYDATNCNVYYRKKFVDDFRDWFDVIVAICYNGTLDICLDRNSKRERIVPEPVVRKMFKNLIEHGYPSVKEGFDLVITFSEARDIFQLSNGQVS